MQSEVKLAGWTSGELMGNFSSKLPWGNTVSLQEIWVKINHNCMQAHTHRDRRTAYMIWLWVFWHTNNDNTQKYQEHSFRRGKKIIIQCFVFATTMIILFYLFGGSGEEGELPLGPPHLRALGLSRARLSPPRATPAHSSWAEHTPSPPAEDLHL